MSVRISGASASEAVRRRVRGRATRRPAAFLAHGCFDAVREHRHEVWGECAHGLAPSIQYLAVQSSLFFLGLSRVHAAQALSEAFQTSVEKAPRREVCPRAQIPRSQSRRQAGGAGRSSLAARGSHSSTGVATLSHQSSLNGESQRRSRKKIGNRRRAAGQVRHPGSQASRKLRSRPIKTRPAAASRRTRARAAARTRPAPRPRATPS